MHPVFNYDDLFLRQLSQIVQLPVIDAVRAGTYHQAGYGRMGQGLFIEPAEPFQGPVCIGICLEISKIALDFGIASTMEPDSFLYLLEKRLSRDAVSRMEGGVVAICAASGTDRAVPVGAGETGIEYQFLQPLSVLPPIMAGESVVSLTFRKVVHGIAKVAICGYFYNLKPKGKMMNCRLSVLIASMALMVPAIGTLAQSGRAVVELSANFMREEPDFAAELGDQALMGTVVEILEKSGDWVKVKSPDPYTAWVESRGLVMMDDQGISDYLEAPKYICTAGVSHIYEEPSLKSRIVSEFILGDLVRIIQDRHPYQRAIQRI